LLQSDIVLLNEIWFRELRILYWIMKANLTATKIFIVPHGSVYLIHPDQNVGIGVEESECGYRQYNFATSAGVALQYFNSRKKAPRDVIPYDGTYQISLQSLHVENQEGWLSLERWVYVGYPAFDTWWFSYISKMMSANPHFSSVLPTKRRRLRCLFVMRDITLKHNHIWQTTGDEFNLIVTALKDLTRVYDLEIVVKPHPSQNLAQLKGLLFGSSDKYIYLVQEPIISILPSTDFAITVHTSGAYFPMIWGVPTIHLIKPSSYKDFPKIFYDLETNARHAVWDLIQLYAVCAKLVDDLVHGNSVPNDVEHMRKYYPDGSIQLIMGQLRPYLEGDSN